MVLGRWPGAREAAANTARQTAGAVSLALSLLLGRRAGAAFGILVYHRIAPATPGIPFPSINVTRRRFRRQLMGLHARGYEFRSLRTVLDNWRAGQPISPRTVVVTFDDGFESVYRHAYPVLRELGVPATVFLNTAYLDQMEPFPFDAWGVAHRGRVPPGSYRPLTTRQCEEMARDGLVELGAHTHTHRDLRGRPEEFGRDVKESLDVVRERFRISEVTFAFPFGRRHLGYVTPDLMEAARRTGVVCALTTEAEPVSPRSDPFGWGRFNAYDWDDGATLAARLEGWYGWAPQLQERLFV